MSTIKCNPPTKVEVDAVEKGLIAAMDGGSKLRDGFWRPLATSLLEDAFDAQMHDFSVEIEQMIQLDEALEDWGTEQRFDRALGEGRR